MFKHFMRLFALIPRGLMGGVREYTASRNCSCPSLKEVVRALVVLIIIAILLLLVLWLSSVRSAMLGEIVGLERRIEALQDDNIKMYKLSQLYAPVETAIPRSMGWEAATFDVTAYAPYDNVSGMCNDGSPNVTATGSTPAEGTIAVNFEIIPPYSDVVVMYEDGDVEVGKALDTGGALRAPGVRKIDVFRRTYVEASRHGVRKATVFWRYQGWQEDETFESRPLLTGESVFRLDKEAGCGNLYMK